MDGKLPADIREAVIFSPSIASVETSCLPFSRVDLWLHCIPDQHETERFFPKKEVNVNLWAHPLRQEWAAHRLALDAPQASFIQQLGITHVTGIYIPDESTGRACYEFRMEKNETTLGRITTLPPGSFESSLRKPILTYWALYDLLLPTFYLLAAGMQWPQNHAMGASNQDSLHCPQLQEVATSAEWTIGSVAIPAAPAGWKRQVRVIQQSRSRMDLAWIDQGTTIEVLSFEHPENYMGNTVQCALIRSLIMLSTTLSCMLGQDVSNLMDRGDARIPCTPPREDKTPGTPIALPPVAAVV